MTRNERRRLLSFDRRVAFAEELAALCNRYRFKAAGRYTTLAVMEEGEAQSFLIDEDGDLASQLSSEPPSFVQAEARKNYERRVANGRWGNDDDTDDDEGDEAPKPKLTLPLTVGQKFTTVGRGVHVVTNINERDGMAYARTEDGMCLWADTGRADGEGRHNFGDAKRCRAVADVEPEPKAEPKAKRKAKAKLTLPLKAGQRVKLSDGQIGVVKGEVDCDGDIKIHHPVNDHSFWHEAATGKFVGDGNDAVADAS